MKNELAFQTKLVNTLNDMGAHAFKSNNRFKAGILDIHYTRTGGGVTTSAFVECKFRRQANLTKVVCGPTPKQQQFSRKERAAGGLVYGLCWVQHPKNREWLVVQFDPCGPTKQQIDTEGLLWNDHNFTSRDVAQVL